MHNPPLVPTHSIPLLSINTTLISLFTTVFSLSDSLYTLKTPVFLSYLFKPSSVAIHISLSIPVIDLILLLLNEFSSYELKYLVTSPVY